MAVATARNSATFMVTAPATVIGAVAPAMGIGYTTSGPPCRAISMFTSRNAPPMPSGE